MAASKTFNDVSEGHWAYDIINEVVDARLFVGTSDTTFEPSISMNRAMFVTVLANLSGEAWDNNVETKFDDVAYGAWYAGAVAWAVNSGVTAGISDTRFDPNSPVTREQMATFVVNYTQWAGITLKDDIQADPFTDAASISNWAIDAVTACQSAGILVGMGDGTYQPKASTTRAQAASVFLKLLNIINSTPTIEIESDIYGEAFINGYSTLKAEECREVEYDPNGAAVLTLSLPNGAAIDDSKIDSSDAVVSLSEGDGYYVSELILNNTVLDGVWENGQTSYTLDTGDLEWNNWDYPVDNGGREWSGIGGNGNGHYDFNLSVSGITYDGVEVPAQTFRVHIYIYGREFSGGTNGAAGYDDLELPEAEFKALENPPEVEDEPVWTWIGDGDLPIVCDYLTDDFYITWPEDVDASGLTAEDFSLNMYSQYGDVYTLTAGEEYEVQSSEGETQIAVTLVYWPFTPVYTTMEIAMDTDQLDTDLESVSKIYDIASVYTHMVQTGGGIDRNATVVCYNFYGVENLSSWDQVASETTYVYAYRDPSAGSRDPYEYYYAEDENGNGSIVYTEAEATVYDGTGEEDRNLQLVGNTVYITARVDHTKVFVVDGVEYKMTKVYSGARVTAPDASLVASPGYIITPSANWDTQQRWAWLYINGEDWLAD